MRKNKDFERKIIRLNGYRVEAIVHKESISLEEAVKILTRNLLMNLGRMLLS